MSFFMLAFSDFGILNWSIFSSRFLTQQSVFLLHGQLILSMIVALAIWDKSCGVLLSTNSVCIPRMCSICPSCNVHIARHELRRCVRARTCATCGRTCACAYEKTFKICVRCACVRALLGWSHTTHVRPNLTTNLRWSDFTPCTRTFCKSTFFFTIFQQCFNNFLQILGCSKPD